MFHGEKTGFSERNFTVHNAQLRLLGMVRTLSDQKSASSINCPPSRVRRQKVDLANLGRTKPICRVLPSLPAENGYRVKYHGIDLIFVNGTWLHATMLIQG
jgi:hypothetical protein